MAKLTRKSAKVFAEQANAAVGGIAQFGSLAAGDIQYSKDVDVIQALDAYKEGWASAVVGNKSPAMEDRNALDYLLSYQQAYIMQHGIPEWLSTETYYENSYVVDSNGELRVSTIDNNTGHDPIEDEGGQYWGYAGSRGSGKQIGEVYYSQSKLATDNKGALPLFTGELISNANNLYPQFYAWVLSHTELCKTQAQYDTAISTYGECPYYVINDTNKTIRLPKLTNYIKMANSTNGITQSKAGLPDHTHTYEHARIPDMGKYQGNSPDAGPRGFVTAITSGASDTNGIYGASNTVTPAHTTLYPWVCAYNGAAPASIAQAAQFEQALTSKADVDFANVNETGTSSCAGWAMPSNVFDELTLGASGTSYTMPANGWLWLDKTNGTTDRYILFRCSSLSIPGEYTCCNPGTNTHLTLLMPVKKGDVITVNYNATGTTNYFRFIYAEGSKSEAN